MPPVPPSQQFLIPPFLRFRFTIAFTVATGFGWFLIWLVLRSMQDPLLPPLASQQGLTMALITGLVSGLMVSAMQWLVLRRYLADWLWILTSTTGYVLLTVSLEASWEWIGVITKTQPITELFEHLASEWVIFAASGLRVLVTTISALWLGLTQWLFLRQYTKSNIWWLVVPAIAVLLSSSFAFASVLLLWAGIKLPLQINVLAAGILGSTQAIAFCKLKKRTVNLTVVDQESVLRVAPEILDYRLVCTLSNMLQRRLNLAWTTEHLNDDALTYLVGVTQTGEIAAYMPINTPAIEQLNEIPLPKLTTADQNQDRGMAEPLARFEVTFLASGSLQVLAWSGIPLKRVALTMLVTVLCSSAIAAFSVR